MYRIYLIRKKSLKSFTSNSHNYVTELSLIKNNSTRNDFNIFINLISIIDLSPDEFFMGFKSQDDIDKLNRNPAIANSSVFSEKVHRIKNKYYGFTGLLIYRYARRNISILDKLRINLHQYRDSQIKETDYKKRIEILEESRGIDIYFNPVNRKESKNKWENYYNEKAKYLRLKLKEQREEVRESLFNKKMESQIISENAKIDLLNERRCFINEKKTVFLIKEEERILAKKQKLIERQELQDIFMINTGVKQVGYNGNASELYRYCEYFIKSGFIYDDQDFIKLFFILGKGKIRLLNKEAKVDWHGNLIILTYFFKILQNKKKINGRVNIFSFISSCFTNSGKLVKSNGKGQRTEFNTLKKQFLNSETLEPNNNAPNYIQLTWKKVSSVK